eukprot:TRINITY_DN19283_c0_g1_i1.p1 TRINITY_DN19283_c0_g1~~TRINITY_DN19283_c0_g1_i1.p1  ORF type:complete len:206 (+),score=33.87 TRINITY_DN19283_c0_g1_i1:619-1236(+)
MLRRTATTQWIDKGRRTAVSPSDYERAMGNVSTSTREKRERAWKGLSESQIEGRKRNMMKDKRHEMREKDYWDIVPSEFKTESELMRATGAGFNSMYEDPNKRSVAIADELSQSRFKPPFTARPRTSSPSSLHDLYSDIPELSLLSPFSSRPRVRSAPTTPETVLHPDLNKYAAIPFPISKRKNSAWPMSNYNPRKDPEYESRVP